MRRLDVGRRRAIPVARIVVFALLAALGAASGANGDSSAADDVGGFRPLDPRGPWDPVSRGFSDLDLRSAVVGFRTQFRRPLDRDLEDLAARAVFDSLYSAAFWSARRDSLPRDGGKLAWGSSRDALSLLVLYEATADTAYLRRAWEFGLAALALRDDRTGAVNFRGTTLPVWGSDRYGDGRRTDYLVHNALILQPILETLAHLEGCYPHEPMVEGAANSLGAAGASIDDDRRARPPRAGSGGARIDAPWAPPAARRALLESCMQTLRVYQSDFRIGPAPDEGYFAHSDEEGERERRPQPYNRVLVLGWNLVLAGLLTEDDGWIERGSQVARFFRNRVFEDEVCAFGWSYEPDWPGLDRPLSPVTWCDDVSHGFYTVEPIPKLARAGIVFTAEDLERFGRTLTERIYNAEYDVFLCRVCGSAMFSSTYAENLPGWLCLSEGAPEVYPLLSRFVLEHVEEPRPLFLAYLIRYRTRS